MFFLRLGSQPPRPGRNGMLWMSVLCIGFGLLILADPDILAELIAIFLIIMGASMLSIWWSMNKKR